MAIEQPNVKETMLFWADITRATIANTLIVNNMKKKLVEDVILLLVRQCLVSKGNISGLHCRPITTPINRLPAAEPNHHFQVSYQKYWRIYDSCYLDNHIH